VPEREGKAPGKEPPWDKVPRTERMMRSVIVVVITAAILQEYCRFE
jgi:hypothetical protein